MVSSTSALENILLNGFVFGNDGQPIEGAVITFTDSATQKTIASTTTGTNKQYAVSIPGGNYSITVSDNNLSMTKTFTEEISSNSIKNFTLATTKKSLIVPKTIIPGVPLDSIQLVFVGIAVCLFICILVSVSLNRKK
jgi:hypothetical protein